MTIHDNWMKRLERLLKAIFTKVDKDLMNKTPYPAQSRPS